MKKFKIISFILCCLLCAIMCFPCCGTLNGPYHHEALICQAYDVIDVEGNKYYQYFYGVYRLENGTFTLVSEKSSNSEEFVHCEDMCTDGQYLYVASVRGLVMKFSSDYDYLSTFDLFDNGTCRSIVVNDDIIYYQHDYDDELTLYACNLQTGEKTLVAKEFCDKTLSVDGKTLFSNSLGQLYWEDEIQGVNQAYGYYRNGFNQSGYMENGQYLFSIPQILQELSISFCYNSIVGKLSVAPQSVIIEYNGNEYEYKISGDTLYDNIVLYGDKLYFAAYDYMADNECINPRCICHMGQSQLISFDFKSGSFELLHTLEEGAYITFNGQIYTYYQDGEVYRENQKIMQVEEISPYGEYKTYIPGQYLKWSYVSQSIFYDDGSTLYYYYNDNRPYLKDTY